MKKLFVAAALSTTLLSQGGCAVFMAANGDQRTETVTKDDGTTEKQKVGSPPSAGRAVAWAVLDVLTGGLTELVLTPVELGINAANTKTVTTD